MMAIVRWRYSGIYFVSLTPNEYTLNHLHVAFSNTKQNHNVRFQFIKWKNDITLGEMMVSEGLAENFATSKCMVRIKRALGY